MKDDNIDGMHEGERLKEVLDRKGLTQADFGRLCGVSRSAVWKYYRAKSMDRRMWAKVRNGLLAAGIDPANIRPEEPAVEEEDLVPRVEHWPDEQLLTLRMILTSTAEARKDLVKWLNGALRKHTVPPRQ